MKKYYYDNGSSFLSQSLTTFGLLFTLLLLLPAVVKAQCSITLKPTVSGCYSVSGVSKATISVEVSWSSAPANDYIVVTTGSQSRTITPGIILATYAQPGGATSLTANQVIVSPQVVAFEVPANGLPQSLTASFATASTCKSSTSVSAPPACNPIVCANGQLGGRAFKDFNTNGIQNSGETQGLAGITVTAYDCDGKKYGPLTTDANGDYLFTASIKYPVRVEFTTITGQNTSSVFGSNSKTTVQFVNQATCRVDLGIGNPSTYCQDDLRVFVPCYTYGDPLASAPADQTNWSANADALIGFPYGISSTNMTGETVVGKAKEIGTVWGLAYNRFTKDVFTSASVQRHAGLGPLGLGGIYVSKPGSTSVTPFISVTALGINVGTVPSNSVRGLVSDKTKPSYDVAVFSKIGKVGIGGLEVSEDGQSLWFVNMSDKKLYSINIAAYK